MGPENWFWRLTSQSRQMSCSAPTIGAGHWVLEPPPQCPKPSLQNEFSAASASSCPVLEAKSVMGCLIGLNLGYSHTARELRNLVSASDLGEAGPTMQEIFQLQDGVQKGSHQVGIYPPTAFPYCVCICTHAYTCVK